ncbi:MAG TPA: SUMF1/EgtB/PvdO family nonheme iron enzyme [Candidatus Angelobacter sp.]|jgi:formylglycine-generating enzyme required for sulfatase activity
MDEVRNGWIFVPEGPAWIGAEVPGEGPPQLLSIPSFWITRCKITNREFLAFVNDGGYSRPEFWDADGLRWLRERNVTTPAFWDNPVFNGLDRPVTGVSFYEAMAYACWAKARLPWEAEWEKAARGEDGRPYPWGHQEPDSNMAHFAPDFVPVKFETVAAEGCPDGDSPYGCRQMAGNLYEWCLDFFHVDTPPRRSAAILAEIRPSRRRLLKGGAWTTGSDRLRASARWSQPPEVRDNIMGIRLVSDHTRPSGAQEDFHDTN